MSLFGKSKYLLFFCGIYLENSLSSGNKMQQVFSFYQQDIHRVFKKSIESVQYEKKLCGFQILLPSEYTHT